MSLVKRDQEIYLGLTRVTASQPSQKVDQQRFEIDLTTARDYEEISGVRDADFMLVESLNGTAKVRINEVKGPEYDLTVYHSFVKSSSVPIQRIFLYNAAQAGKTLKLSLGGDASFQATTNPTVAAIEGAINIANAAGDTVNPFSHASTPAIYNVTLTNANTEYSQALTLAKKILVHCRDATSIIRLAFVTGKVAAPTEPYLTIPATIAYNDDGILFTGTIYVASATAGAVVEILAWT